MGDSTVKDSSKWFSSILLISSMIKIRIFRAVNGIDKTKIRC